MARIKKKQTHKKRRFNKKSRRNTKKIRTSKTRTKSPSLSITSLQYLTKQKGGFKADDVDILEDRDDDWMVTKQ